MEDCPICYEPLDGTLVTIGCCKKMFHMDCYTKCMYAKPSCPMCRTNHVYIVPSVTVMVHPQKKFSLHHIICVYTGVYIGWAITTNNYGVLGMALSSLVGIFATTSAGAGV